MSKISFRFYKDHEVRAIWDEENSKWWFSVQDVVGAINDQSDYKKNRNYWKYLKTKLRKEGNELVSATNQLISFLAKFGLKILPVVAILFVVRLVINGSYYILH